MQIRANAKSNQCVTAVQMRSLDKNIFDITYGIFITYDKQHLYFLKCIQKSLQVQSLVLLETFVVGFTANQSDCLLLFSTDILMIFIQNVL